MINMQNAFNNTVQATCNGKTSISLKEIGLENSFEIKLRNYGNKAVTFKVENPGGILTQWEESSSSELKDISLPKEKAYLQLSHEIIRVPANDEVTLKCRLNLSKEISRNRFIEGFITLTSKEASTITMPFVGFHGDWNKDPIINSPVWKESKYNMPKSYVIGRESGEEYPIFLGATDFDNIGYPIVDTDKIAISPNDDKALDELIPVLYHLRNSRKTEVEILDKNKQFIAKLKEANSIDKMLYESNDPNAGMPKEFECLKWNGKIVDTKTNTEKVLPDGQYYINLKSYIHYKNSKPQNFIIPVKVDTKAPKLEILSSNLCEGDTYELQWKWLDDGSGVKEIPYILVDDKLDLEATNEGKFEYDKNTKTYKRKIKLNPNGETNIKIGAYDFAKNMGATNIKVKCIKN